MSDIARLRDFVQEITRLVESAGGDESRILKEGRVLLGDLVGHDDWLPDDFAKPHPEHYQQYLLHADPLERLSVVSFVWGPGQTTPVHDHTVWGLIGILRGAELCAAYSPTLPGQAMTAHVEERLEAGQIGVVSPTIGDVHKVSNALADRQSISIHVYGTNIGAVRRHVFDPETGEAKEFISGYSSPFTPNLWDRSDALRH